MSSDVVFNRLMQELAFRAGRHAAIAKKMTMAAMVNWFVFNADLTSHIVPEKNQVVDQRKVFRNKCIMFKNNRNDIYGAETEMQVLDIALAETNRPSAQEFKVETPAIMGDKADKHYIHFAANTNVMTKETPAHTLQGVHEAITIELPTAKTNVIHADFRRSNAA